MKSVLIRSEHQILIKAESNYALISHRLGWLFMTTFGNCLLVSTRQSSVTFWRQLMLHFFVPSTIVSIVPSILILHTLHLCLRRCSFILT